MKNITFPDRKKFIALLLANADRSSYDIELLTDNDRRQFLVDTVKSELGWMLKDHGPFKMSLHWLQGLASACTIPFMNSDILRWLESQGYMITPHNESIAIDRYWSAAAQALVSLINNKGALK